MSAEGLQDDRIPAAFRGAVAACTAESHAVRREMALGQEMTHEQIGHRFAKAALNGISRGWLGEEVAAVPPPAPKPLRIKALRNTRTVPLVSALDLMQSAPIIDVLEAREDDGETLIGLESGAGVRIWRSSSGRILYAIGEAVWED